ncbi:PQQ-binding-like beta-propeller repeat protein [Actinacidiphila alni]|uniref:caspase, EACC1-associated type n=1 Tax=Actinacidiphila alni TaxID=380248 RepID=UPI0033FBD6A1
MGRRLALLIATYAHEDAGLRQLTAPAHDAEALGETLRDPDIAGFEVTTLVNQPHYEVGRAIGELCRDRRRDDLVLLYFTGHGLKDDAGRLHLAMTNTRRDNLAFTSLPAELVDRALADCMSRRQVLILDCCYGGAFPTAGGLTKSDGETHALERFGGRGRTVLTAADASQFSFESDGALRGGTARSVFTHHLVRGLRDGTADLDGDGDITLDELYAYVHEKVVDEMPQQRPKKQADVEGQIVIARNVRWTLPAHLANSLDSPIATDRLGAVDGLARLLRIGNPLVRERATGELERLAEDDSRRVSAAAVDVLRSLIREPRDGQLLDGGPETAPEPVAEVPEVPSVVPVDAAIDDLARQMEQLAEDRAATEADLARLMEELREAKAAAAAPAAPEPEPDPPSRSGGHAFTASGSLRWTVQLPAGVTAPLVAVDGTVYAATGADLYALDAATGRVMWRFVAGGTVIAEPVVADGIVYVCDDRGRLYAVSGATGEAVWQFLARRTGRPNPGALALSGESVYYCHGYDIHGVDRASGRMVWHKAPGMSFQRWAAVSGGKLWTGNDGRSVYGFALDGGPHKHRFAIRGGSWSGQRAEADGVLYAGSPEGTLLAIDTGVGGTRWSHWMGSGGAAAAAAPVVAGRLVHVVTYSGDLRAFDVITGNERWRAPLAGPAEMSPAVADGVVYVADRDAVVHARDAATGEVRWQIPTSGPVTASPAVADGAVFVGDINGEVVALTV